MRILVTGGAGYIGSHLVQLLQTRGDEVVVLDTLERGYRAALSNCPLVVGDVRDEACVEGALRTHAIEAVIHLAAYKEPAVSMRDPGSYFANNVVGTLSLLRAMQRADIRTLIFSSSCAVYGEPGELPVRETTPLQPNSPYGESKLIGENLLRWFEQCHGLCYVSLRYFNVAGASLNGVLGEDLRSTSSVVPQILKVALGQCSGVTVFGRDYPTPDGTAVRDYTHVLDLAQVHAQALDFLVCEGRSETFNVGTGKPVSVYEMITLAESISGRPIPVIDGPRRPGDPSTMWADASKAHEMLNWHARYSVHDMISTAWQWYQRHPNGYPAQT